MKEEGGEKRGINGEQEMWQKNGENFMYSLSTPRTSYTYVSVR
jgi:hypothetical protein